MTMRLKFYIGLCFALALQCEPSTSQAICDTILSNQSLQLSLAGFYKDNFLLITAKPDYLVYDFSTDGYDQATNQLNLSGVNPIALKDKWPYLYFNESFKEFEGFIGVKWFTMYDDSDKSYYLVLLAADGPEKYDSIFYELDTNTVYRRNGISQLHQEKRNHVPFPMQNFISISEFMTYSVNKNLDYITTSSYEFFNYGNSLTQIQGNPQHTSRKVKNPMGPLCHLENNQTERKNGTCDLTGNWPLPIGWIFQDSYFIFSEKMVLTFKEAAFNQFKPITVTYLANENFFICETVSTTAAASTRNASRQSVNSVQADTTSSFTVVEQSYSSDGLTFTAKLIIILSAVGVSIIGIVTILFVCVCCISPSNYPQAVEANKPVSKNAQKPVLKTKAKRKLDHSDQLKLSAMSSVKGGTSQVSAQAAKQGTSEIGSNATRFASKSFNFSSSIDKNVVKKRKI